MVGLTATIENIEKNLEPHSYIEKKKKKFLIFIIFPKSAFGVNNTDPCINKKQKKSKPAVYHLAVLLMT